MKKFLEYIQLGSFAVYFFLYMAGWAVRKIIEFICWYTIVPVFCIGLLVADKIKRLGVRMYG